VKSIVAVVGPTASGKTSLGVELAEALDTEIISADSMQFYRGMEIGTGAPSREELARVKHHFIGHLTPDQEMSAAEFQQDAREVVANLNAQGKPAVVVGGSGLYIQALIDGLFEGPGKDQDIRDRLEVEAESDGADALYRRLVDVDPEYAARISFNDLRRIVRALEVYELTGSPFSTLHREHQVGTEGMDAIQFAIDYPRDELYARIDRRVDEMISMGLVDEIKQLVGQGYGSDIRRLKSLGYREMLDYVEGTKSLEEAIELMKMFTRRYAKRQLTWFKGDTRVRWLEKIVEETNLFQSKQIILEAMS
jgi:tRNA dimethylallyltransferase